MTRFSGVWRWVAVLCFLLSLSGSARADRRHKVKQGQTLGVIAKRYRVSVLNLAAANGLKKSSKIRVGQSLRIPPRGVVYVYSGQTLSGIAKANRVGTKALARANGIKPTATLRVGQRLKLPGYKANSQAIRRRNQKLSGLVSLARPASKEEFRARLFTKQGKVNSKVRRQLRDFLRDRDTGDAKLPSIRLMRALAFIADHFNGRTIVVVSAYRSAKDGNSPTSRHSSGEAIDIRIEGAENEALRDYCLTLSRVGVGYYPRSSFVHLDVRDESIYWVDWSRPGEPPLYLPPGETPETYDAGTSTAIVP